ncbi:hypothetical protein GIB67_021098, partial [Kingdonia uniflora]
KIRIISSYLIVNIKLQSCECKQYFDQLGWPPWIHDYKGSIKKHLSFIPWLKAVSKPVDLARKYYTHVVSCSCSVSPLQVYDTLVNEDCRCSSFQW